MRRDATRRRDRTRLTVKSDSVRQARVEGTNRERASVTFTHRPVAGAPKCLISTSGASVALRRRRPIGGPRTHGGSAHRRSPVALFLVTTGHSSYANVHGASSRSASAPVAVTVRDGCSRLFLRRLKSPRGFVGSSRVPSLERPRDSPPIYRRPAPTGVIRLRRDRGIRIGRASPETCKTKRGTGVGELSSTVFRGTARRGA